MNPTLTRKLILSAEFSSHVKNVDKALIDVRMISRMSVIIQLKIFLEDLLPEINIIKK